MPRPRNPLGRAPRPPLGRVPSIRIGRSQPTYYTTTYTTGGGPTIGMVSVVGVLFVISMVLFLIISAVQWVALKVTEAAQYLTAHPPIEVGIGVLVGMLLMGGIWIGFNQVRDRTLYRRRVWQQNRRLRKQP